MNGAGGPAIRARSRRGDGAAPPFAAPPPPGRALRDAVISEDGPLAQRQVEDPVAAESTWRGERDLNALMSYIEQLELRLAKKDGAIEALESQVHLMRSGASTAFSSEAAPDDSLVPATPTQVSDESGETAGPDDGPGSHSPAISLSRISRVPSWDTEASPPAAADVGADADAAGVDGRWNIPFDASFDDELVPRSPPGSSAAFAPGSSAFVPIGGLGLAPRLGEGRRRSAGTASPLRRPAPRGCGTASPLAPRAVRPAHKGAARRSFGAAARDKENVSPRRSSAGTVIDVGAYRVVR